MPESDRARLLKAPVKTYSSLEEQNGTHESKEDESDDHYDGGKPTYGLLTGLAVMSNYMIGSGVFSLPFGFYLAGLPLALGCLFLFSFLSTLCTLWVPEFLARANGALMLQGQDRTSRQEQQHQGVHSNYMSYRKLDFALVAELFGGLPLKAFCQLAMLGYVYTVLWSYAAAWASSVDTIFFQYALGRECNYLAEHDYSCSVGYYSALIIFGVFSVIVSLLDVSEQAGIQRIMTGYRVVAFCLMCFSVFVALLYTNPFDPNASKEWLHTSNINHVDWTGFGTMFGFTAVAFNVQYNLPDVLQPIRRSEKKSIGTMVLFGMLIATSFYLFVGWICALLFGPQTLPLVTLNWEHYTGVDGGWGEDISARSPLVGLVALIVKLTIICFPVMNVLSAYPLVAVTLGDNLLYLLPDSAKDSYGKVPEKTKKLFRLLASVPPVLAAAMLTNLGKIMTLTGLFAFFLELTIPCLLQLLSERYMVKNFGPGSEVTMYRTVFSGPVAIYSVLILSSFSFLFGAYQALSYILTH